MNENWPEILHQCIDDARGKPFERGKHDCCMWAADVVLAMTGIDYASDFRGRYKTMRGALKALRKRPLDVVLDEKFSRIKHPCRCDLVLIPTTITRQPIAGVGIYLGDVVAFIGDGGLEFMPLPEPLTAWAVNNG